MCDRVTAYAIQSDGSRSFGVTVNGIGVLVTARDDHGAGMALAERIAELGPDAIPAPPPVAAPKPPAPPVRKNRTFVVGQRVWCNVHGAQGFCTITSVGEGRNRGRVKISGERCWCPASNFDVREES